MTPEKFWSLVDQSAGPDACWPWLAGTSTAGYGRVRFHGERQEQATRVAFELAHGRPPAPDLLLRHTCDNPPCTNPAHLIEGTMKQNIGDMMERGRGWFQKGTCPKGHPWTPENSLPIAGSDGRWKRCRTCMRINAASRRDSILARQKAHYYANREAINAARREQYRAKQEARRDDLQSGFAQSPESGAGT